MPNGQWRTTHGYEAVLGEANGSFCIFQLVSLIKESYEKWAVHNVEWAMARSASRMVVRFFII